MVEIRRHLSTTQRRHRKFKRSTRVCPLPRNFTSLQSRPKPTPDTKNSAVVLRSQKTHPGRISIQLITRDVYLSSSSSCASSTVAALGTLSLDPPFPSVSSACWPPRLSAATPLTSAAAAVAPLLLPFSPVSAWYPKGPTVRSPPKNWARPPQFGASGMGAVTTGGCLRAAVSGTVAPCDPGRRDGSGMLLVGGLPSCPLRWLPGAGLVPRDRGWLAKTERNMSWAGAWALCIGSDGGISPSSRWRGSNDHPGGMTTPSGKSALPAGMAVPCPALTCLVTVGWGLAARG